MREGWLLLGLLMLGLFVDTLEGWPLTIAGIIAVAVLAVAIIAIKQGSTK